MVSTSVPSLTIPQMQHSFDATTSATAWRQTTSKPSTQPSVGRKPVIGTTATSPETTVYSSYVATSSKFSCKHGGKFITRDGRKRCICTKDFHGHHCEKHRGKKVQTSLQHKCSKKKLCKNGGKCYLKGKKAKCKCKRGFFGHRCHKKRNHCSLKPCGPGGICKSLKNGFRCHCKAGYNGKLCQRRINPCLKVPCKNSGRCLALLRGNRFKCICPETHFGELCETRLDPCRSQPCWNGGDCKEKEKGYTCICNEGYSGPLCELSVAPCWSNPCQHQGSCIGVGNFFQCMCPVGYTGSLCENQTPCNAENKCQNGGSCEKSNCICTSGYTGSFCENGMEQWTNRKHCEPGGTCYEYRFLDHVHCKCPLSHAGKRCEAPCIPCDGSTGESCGTTSAPGKVISTGQPSKKTDTHHCRVGICRNGGDCISEDSSYRCKCRKGFKGKNCEIMHKACSENPCKNAGICHKTSSRVNRPTQITYLCICQPGYSGYNCEFENPCENIECTNKGRCVPTLKDDKYIPVCKCPAGFGDDRCEKKLEIPESADPCRNHPCKNDGKCKGLHDGRDFTCDCSSGFTGHLCELKDHCASSPCVRGKCIPTPDGHSFSCKCPETFTGEYLYPELVKHN